MTLLDIEEFLNEPNANPRDWFYYDDRYVVHEVGPNGELQSYEGMNYYGEDYEGNEVELDEPEPNGDIYVYHPDSNGRYAYTLQMLEALKNTPQNTLDSICKKVLQLYRKHNNSNAEFKWQGV
jgi:hypothetical protein